MSAVTAVIGNYNGETVLADCIRSLANQTEPPCEIIVVDAASTDSSPAQATELGARVIDEANLGLGHLYNRGVDEAKTDLVFLANNDIAAAPDCLARLAAAVEADETILAADAQQLDWAGTRTIHARTTLSRGRMLREYLPGLHLDHVAPAAEVVSTVCANGAAMLVRRSSFQALDGFDETFFMEWEDLDLSWRGWLSGQRTVYVPDAVVRHHVGAATTARELPRRSASSHHNLVRFALKCLPRSAAARVVLGELMRLPAHPPAVAAGLSSVVRELPEILGERRRLAPHTETLRYALEGRL